MRLSYNSTQVASRRRLPPAAAQVVRRYGERIRVLELQGPLLFSTFEPVVRSLVRQAPYCKHVILNFRHVVSADGVSLRLLTQVREELLQVGVSLLCSSAGKLTKSLLAAGVPQDAMFVDDDMALEVCEDSLLAEVMKDSWRSEEPIALAECSLFIGCDAGDLEVLHQEMPLRSYGVGETIIARGSPADQLFVIVAGRVEVCLLNDEADRRQRLDVLSAGMSFGEMAFIDGAARSADVVTLEPVECREMPRSLFDVLEEKRPGLTTKILGQIARQLSNRLRQSNTEISALRNQSKLNA